MHASFLFLQVTTHQIKGEVYEIERMNECTEVIVNEGYREASYVLDEALIRFGGALDDGEYSLAVSILEPLEVTPEVQKPDCLWITALAPIIGRNQIVIALELNRSLACHRYGTSSADLDFVCVVTIPGDSLLNGSRLRDIVVAVQLGRFSGLMNSGCNMILSTTLQAQAHTPYPLTLSSTSNPSLRDRAQAAAMWQQLGEVALEEGDITIAERCAAALGDVSRARFLHKVTQYSK